MADGVEWISASDRKPIVGSVLAPAGSADPDATATLMSPVTVTIYDNRRNICKDGSGVPLSGLAVSIQDNGPQQEVRAVFFFCAAERGLGPGVYIVTFHADVQASDTLPLDRLENPSIRIRVLPDAS